MNESHEIISVNLSTLLEKNVLQQFYKGSSGGKKSSKLPKERFYLEVFLIEKHSVVGFVQKAN